MIARAFLFMVLGLCAVAAARPAGAVEAGDILRAVVRIEAEVPAQARTAEFLGTHREASGVVIDDNGLVLTIGYIILEAMAATVTDAAGRTVPADIVAYDYDTGFGLLRAIAPIDAKPLRFGDSDRLEASDRVLVVGAGGADHVSPALVTRRDTFAGYWEYLLESAIYTAPPHPDWAGTALVGADGRLLGIGSLYIDDAARGAEPHPGNMFVPINLLKPILGDLLEHGRAAGPPRPWMGLFTRDVGGHVVVARVIPGGPGEAAGISAGGLITKVAGQSVSDMADLFRKVWALGSAGVEVPLTIEDESGARAVVLRSANRYDYLRLNPTY
jgi:S1-C subfamily serine protease